MSAIPIIFKTTAEVVACTSAANTNINFASLRPKLLQAQEKYLQPKVGRALLQHILTAYHGSTPLPAPVAALLPRMQAVVATWAMWHYVPISEVSVTDGGTLRHETETSKTAYQNQITNLRRELMDEAHQAEEMLLSHLFALKPNPDAPAPEADALFNLFANSPEFARYNKLLITGPTQLEQLFYSHQPGRNYHTLRPTLYDVQQLLLPHVISPALAWRLLTYLPPAAGPTQATEAEQLPQLMELVCKWLLYTALYRSVASRGLSYDERGLTVYMSTNKATHDDDSKRSHAATDHIDKYHAELYRQAQEWQRALSFFLDANSTNIVWPEYSTWLAQKAAANNTLPEARQPEHQGDNVFGMF